MLALTTNTMMKPAMRNQPDGSCKAIIMISSFFLIFFCLLPPVLLLYCLRLRRPIVITERDTRVRQTLWLQDRRWYCFTRYRAFSLCAYYSPFAYSGEPTEKKSTDHSVWLQGGHALERPTWSSLDEGGGYMYPYFVSDSIRRVDLSPIFRSDFSKVECSVWMFK